MFIISLSPPRPASDGRILNRHPSPFPRFGGLCLGKHSEWLWTFFKMWSKLQAYAYIRITDPNRPFLEVRETIEVYWARGPIVCLHRYIPPFFPYLGYYCTYSTVRTNALSRSARKHRLSLASLSFFLSGNPNRESFCFAFLKYIWENQDDI